jgi:outer membrane protein OmpA-like peptidoglycan-associated protein
MMGATSRRLLASAALLVAWPATPERAQAQSILKRIKDQTAKRVEERRAKLDSAVITTTGGVVDSAVTKSGRGADAVVNKAGSVANTVISATERGVKNVVGGANPGHDIAARLSGGRAVFEEIRFADGSDQIDPASQEVLKHLAAALTGMTGTVLIEGHTDPLAPPGDPQALSQRRATAVKTQLAAQGVPAERMLAVGYGATRPNAANSKANARIEVVRAQ